MIDISPEFSPPELEIIHTVLDMARNKLPRFDSFFDDFFIKRVHRNNVNTNPNIVWYAVNLSGKGVLFGNRVFFSGKQSVTKFPGTFFTSAQLVAHEISHTVNFKCSISQFCGIYANNKNLGFVARSSNLPAEIITDAVANYIMGTMPDTKFMENTIMDYIKERYRNE